jgi:hypothetical protein
MSTPAWKKKLRLEQQAEAKRIREREKKYGLTTVPKKAEKRKFVPLKVSQSYIRETQEVPSMISTAPITGTAVERKQYTGTLVKGIATMHKSNAVPVINDEQAKDLARMRRG